MTCNTKTQLEKALDCVVNVYHQYCILNPVDDYLQIKEFQKMMKEQAQPFIRNTIPPGVSQDAYIKQIFQRADRDKNGSVKFTEFLYVLGACLEEAHHRSHDLGDDHKSGQKPSGHGHGHSH
ncbi:protein S100-A12-like [Eublepharis macularius]|uniref:Protein S100-A12-like n=1 Tax=Eublepharis macularius TaxID=481883 RepID=A0AA97KDG4_EUBMA|nr:protein S100-A12-like [Eublepharis macularius]